MKVTDIFRREPVQPQGDAEKAQKRQHYQAAEQAAVVGRSETADTVSVSTKARDLNIAADALRSDEDARAEKVAAIKEQVEAGTYKVASEDVAKAIISYARDMEDMG